MTFGAGDSIGPYQILGSLGAGGMGEVYRARDTRLDRVVAIKILPDSFATDAERVARFEREAKTLAALNHPNVAQIFGLEQFDGRRALAMELVEGENLAERLRRGVISLDDALTIARQIADGLDAAHDLGIVHRDLKPSNIQLREDGTAKILDFGLAKALAPASSTPDLISSPTIMSPAVTQRGVVLGTAAYMAPEQAKGRVVDKRADIWAFGAVVYEMVTGRRAFEGDDVSEMMAAVLKVEPDWSRVPQPLHRLLKACLEKDPRKRLRDIADWSRLIDDATPAAASPAPRGSWLPWGVAAIGVAVALFVATSSPREPATPEAPPVRFQVPAPENTSFEQALALAPDGRRLAFAARDSDGTSRIWIRELDSVESRSLNGTDGVRSLFWSPDSRSIGFVVDRQMKRIEVAGGSPVTLFESTEAASLGIGAWNESGIIVFGGAFTGALQQVSAAGGTPTPVTRLDQSRRELAHGIPTFLPDGRRFLYYRVSRDPQYMGVFVGSLDVKPEEQDRTPLLFSGHAATLMATSGRPTQLLYLEKGRLMARPFDLDRLQLTGAAAMVADHVSNSGALGLFSTSGNGILAYRTGPVGGGTVLSRLTWVDRQGKVIGAIGDPSASMGFALSPDGTRAIVRDASITNPDLWMVDLTRGISTRFTTNPGPDVSPIWSSDGKRVAYTASGTAGTSIVAKEVGGSAEVPLVEKLQAGQPNDWSSDGRLLVYQQFSPDTDIDLWALPLEGQRQPVKILGTPFAERSARLSPDMRTLAYVSNESGRSEIYLRGFDSSGPRLAPGGHTRVSKDGGDSVRWRSDGKELVFRALNGTIMAVSVGATELGLPTNLFLLPPNYGWDYSRDGQRFLATITETGTGTAAIDVVMNWKTR